MARIRSIKPEFFLDEELGSLSGDHMVLYSGLWCLADREGRLEYRPARIKASLFPYRPVDVPALLDDLAGIGKVSKYAVDGLTVLWLPRFGRHQRPHPKEPASELPPPPESCKKTASREITRQEIQEPNVIPSSPVGREGKGREQDKEGKGTGKPAPPKLPSAPDLEQQLLDAFEAEIGRPYRWGRGDHEALRKLLGEGFPPPDIVAAFRRGLRRKRFPTVTTVAGLEQHWTACLRDEPVTGAQPARANVSDEEFQRAMAHHKTDEKGDLII